MGNIRRRICRTYGFNTRTGFILQLITLLKDTRTPLKFAIIRVILTTVLRIYLLDLRSAYAWA